MIFIIHEFHLSHYYCNRIHSSKRKKLYTKKIKAMKKKNALVMIGLIGVSTVIAGICFDTGKDSSTGAPGEQTCIECHDPGTSGSVNMTSSIANDRYVPGTTYQIHINISHPGLSLFGLDVQALKMSDNSNAGTLIITKSSETQIVSANNKNNLTHKMNGGVSGTPGAKSFDFDWTAPASDIGAVKFYIATIAANGNGGPDGDFTYATIKTINSPTTNVGIEENTQAAIAFSVFPNPVKDVLKIRFSENPGGNIRGTIYAMNGQVVSPLFDENMNNGQMEKQIPLPSGLSSGNYLLEIEHSGVRTTKKICVQ